MKPEDPNAGPRPSALIRVGIYPATRPAGTRYSRGRQYPLRGWCCAAAATT